MFVMIGLVNGAHGKGFKVLFIGPNGFGFGFC
jgi:hypothetical protein